MENEEISFYVGKNNVSNNDTRVKTVDLERLLVIFNLYKSAKRTRPRYLRIVLPSTFT